MSHSYAAWFRGAFSHTHTPPDITQLAFECADTFAKFQTVRVA